MKFNKNVCPLENYSIALYCMKSINYRTDLNGTYWMRWQSLTTCTTLVITSINWVINDLLIIIILSLSHSQAVDGKFNFTFIQTCTREHASNSIKLKIKECRRADFSFERHVSMLAVIVSFLSWMCRLLKEALYNIQHCIITITSSRLRWEVIVSITVKNANPRYLGLALKFTVRCAMILHRKLCVSTARSLKSH